MKRDKKMARDTESKEATPQAIAPGPRRKSRKPNLGPRDPAVGWILPKGVNTILPHSTNSASKGKNSAKS